MRHSLLLALALGLAVPSGAVAASAEVEVMVVGKSRVLQQPEPVRLRARTVQVGRRRCAVGAATPLSVLAGAGLPVRLRDYGSCGRSARDAGSLYVTQVGRERARGVQGWVYKVGNRVGTAGAGDPAVRLRDGQRLLWFWCVQAAGEQCQRTLDARPERSTVAAGAPLRVTVRGHDDAGRGVAVAGARVRLGTAEAVTGPDGVAVLTAPGPGRVAVVAERDGMVRSFPRGVVVG
jgi:hypothetical protein